MELVGGPGEDRTPDPMVANHVLSQLSYRPNLHIIKLLQITPTCQFWVHWVQLRPPPGG